MSRVPPRLRRAKLDPVPKITLFWFTRNLTLVYAAATVQVPVQIAGRADQRKMGKRQGEISHGFAPMSDLFAIQTEMIRVTQHLFEQEACFLQSLRIVCTRARQRFHQPKRADVESSFRAAQSIGRLLDIVAEHQPI